MRLIRLSFPHSEGNPAPPPLVAAANHKNLRRGGARLPAVGWLTPQRTVFTLAAGAALLLAACGGDSIRISAITATPGEGTPTPTPMSVLSGAGGAALIPVPPRPENPFAAGRDLEAYLSGGQPDLEGCLQDVVRTWGLAMEVDGPRCFSVDIDGDGTDEYAFLISFAANSGPNPSDLWFFQRRGDAWRFFNSGRALANASTAGLHVRAVEDITGDDAAEIVATWEECGASTCVTHLMVATHHNGALEDLAPADAFIESLVEFDFDGRTVSMEGGMVASVGAGPQRGATHVISWAGSRFRLETESGEATYLVHQVNDADKAFAAADYSAAQTLYLDAARNSTLPDWKAEVGQAAGRGELQAYSMFRAALAAERSGDTAQSLMLLGRVATEYAGSMHGSIALQYLQALDGGATPGEACSAAEQYIESFQALYVSFWDYGSANPQRSVFTLCR